MICSVEACERPSKGKGCARGFCSMHYQRWARYGDPLVSKIDRETKRDVCSVDGCDNKHVGKGFCAKHRTRVIKTGSVYGLSEKYKCGVKWIERNANYSGDDCLPWPFSVSKHGRGKVCVEKRNISAPRYMCMLVHGLPPTPRHQAAHSCGNGHIGCMNPRHLSWKTSKENEADKIEHGTIRRGTSINTSKLTEADVREIRSIIGVVKGVDIAKKWGITPSMVSSIKNRISWSWLDD